MTVLSGQLLDDCRQWTINRSLLLVDGYQITVVSGQLLDDGSKLTVVR